MIPCYKLVEVRVGSQIVSARPVRWDEQDEDGFGHSVDGKEISAIGFHTTCPSCGELIDFDNVDLYLAIDDSENNLSCGACGAGNKKLETQADSPKEEIQDRKEIEIKSAGFIDPIAEGLFDVEIDEEILGKLTAESLDSID